MLISVRKRFVFVANSKTASTSIENALMAECEIHRGGSAANKHIFLRQAFKQYDFLFNRPKYAPETFFKFGVMRDPLSWIQSWYRYRLGNGSLENGTSFQTFWETKAGPAARSGKRMMQSHYFVKHNGDPIVDYLIPHEDLPTHFDKITSAMGITAKLLHKNKSTVTEMNEVLSDDIIADIRTTLAPDFELYNQIPTLNETGWAQLQNTRQPAEKMQGLQEVELASE